MRKARDEQIAAVLKTIADWPEVTIPQIREKTGVPDSALYWIVAYLKDQGQIKRHGKGWMVIA